MATTTRQLGLDRPAVYEVKVLGELDQDWVDWFDDGRRVSSIVIAAERGVTTVTGTVADQAALHGLLAKVRDLSLTLLSVRRMEGDAPRP